MNQQHIFNKTIVAILLSSIFYPLTATKAEPYQVPAPPDLLENRVKLIQPKGILSFSEALSLALLHNPTLQEFAWAIRIADVKTLQAGLLPNPELSIETENFLGSGQKRNFKQTETTVAISQLFELGGKRAKREALAVTERDLTLWDYETKRMNVIYQVAARYIAVQVKQEQLKVATEALMVAKEIYQTIAISVKAGNIAPIEQNKAHVEWAQARLNEAKIRSELIAEKQNLASVWGSINPLFIEVEGDLFAIQNVPHLSTLIPRLQNNPDMARWGAEIERYRKAITVARAEKIPNITFMAGGRHFANNDDFAAIAGISIPLFVFDNKQTGVDKAEMLLTQAMQKQRAAKVKLHAALINSYQQLKSSQVVITTLRKELLPNARKTFEAAVTAYQLGEIGLLYLLDSQRTLFASSRQHLEALANFQLNVAKIERLIGGALNSPSKKLTGQIQ